MHCLGNLFAGVSVDQQRAGGECSEIDAEDKSSLDAASAASGFHGVAVFQISGGWQSGKRLAVGNPHTPLSRGCTTMPSICPETVQLPRRLPCG